MHNRAITELTIGRLLNTSFIDVYRSLMLDRELSSGVRGKSLAILVVLLNQKCPDLRHLGYRMALAYGNKTGDYEPLYDVAINRGIIPVSYVIDKVFRTDRSDGSFIRNLMDSFSENFRVDNIILTEQQYLLQGFFSDNLDESVAVVAPTSYGKSELIISLLRKCMNKSICILVPTKSLLAQTKKRVLDADVSWVKKVITHPEMYIKGEVGAVFILTQERLMRLLSENPENYFDYVFVDEAHNLLGSDSRNVLLASVICILRSRNANTAFKYLTPFLTDTTNLGLRNAEIPLHEYTVEEYVKSERFFLCDYRKNSSGCVFLYDQFTNQFFDSSVRYSNYIELIVGESLGKNIIYMNRPKRIEEFALELASALPDVDCVLVDQAVRELSRNVNVNYRLVKCMRKGVLYHHGSMPDVIKHYVESLFSKSDALVYLVSSSTLLEGVNLPIERLFLLDNKKGPSNLTPSQFKNLVGRVSRFSDVFREASLKSLEMLEPSIYLIGTNSYMMAQANLEKFLVDSLNVKRTIADKVDNTLLSNTEITEENSSEHQQAVERLENLERGVVEGYDHRYASTRIGELLISSSATEIDVFEQEELIQSKVNGCIELGMRIADSKTLLSVISDCFFSSLNSSRKGKAVARLRNEAAQSFYAMILDWKIRRASFSEMIFHFVRYWQREYSSHGDTLVYVGTWGDTKGDDDAWGEHYVDITRKDKVDKINLAIVRIKEEEDFFEYHLSGYVDVLNEFDLIDEEFYLRINYGTTNPIEIGLIRYGLSRTLAALILSKYRKHVSSDIDGNVAISPSLLPEMRDASEGALLLYEAEMNTRS
tara:strand:+ start:1267 stop:3738 length:2472 start_codon:yes stop_codon:yes gene_type:complete